MREQILRGTLMVGGYRMFKVFEPKERIIHTAEFSGRVMHHAVMNVCEQDLERAAIDDSYACRRGKGSLAAVARGRVFCDGHGWFLKMDIRKYFDSIDHGILYGLLGRQFKDRALMELFGRIIESYETAPGKGLPIGSLTSQHFANFYLAPLDRYVKETLHCRAYVRYMDDFVIWSQERETLAEILPLLERFLEEKLALRFKEAPFINRTSLGMDFLGYRLFPGKTRLNRRSKQRFFRKLRSYADDFHAGVLEEGAVQEGVTALLAFLKHADTKEFRRKVFCEAGATAIGLEPGESRRQLEQQREQPAVSEPQQQHAVQHEQQHRLPVRSQLSLCGGAPLADPAVVLSAVSMIAAAKSDQMSGASSAGWGRRRKLRTFSERL